MSLAKSQDKEKDISPYSFTPYQSAAGEEYMSPRQEEHFVAILKAWKRELMEEVDRTVHHMQDEAANFPHRNVLIRALGQGESLEADVFTVPFPQAGYLMICSDGLWGVISEKDIYRSIAEAPNLHRACQNMVEAANLAGGPDNITVILVQMVG